MYIKYTNVKGKTQTILAYAYTCLTTTYQDMILPLIFLHTNKI